MATIKPHGRRLLVKVDKIEEQIQDGIVLPENRKELPTIGIVTDIGFGGKIPICAEIGDRVLFPAIGSVNTKIGDDQYMLVEDDDVMAVLEYEEE